MNIIIDLQGFKLDDNTFIVKEIAIFKNNAVQVFIFKPPYHWRYLSQESKRRVRWIEKNRGYLWKEGYIPYHLINQHTQPFIAGCKVYVKGVEKIKWLKEICHYDSTNLEEQGCSKLSDLSSADDIFSCILHKKFCALRNVLLLSKWFKNVM